MKHVKQQKIKNMTQEIIKYSQKNGFLFQKFCTSQIIKMLDVYKISIISDVFSEEKHQISIQAFVAVLTSLIPHQENQTLYLVISLYEFFHQLRQKNQNQTPTQTIQLSSLTDYFCQKISNRDPYLVLPVRLQVQRDLPSHQIDIVTEPPIVKHQIYQNLPILSKKKKRKDRTLKKPLDQMVLAHGIKRILALSALAGSIELYDNQLKLVGQIKPNISIKLKKQFPILSVAYSEQQQRIGCVVKNVGLVFWEAADNFETEKIIEGASAKSIHYLQSFKCWITFEKATMKIWDLFSQSCVAKKAITNGIHISCILDMLHLSIFLVAVSMKDSSKFIYAFQFVQRQLKQICKVSIIGTGCHSLHLNPGTKSVVSLGYKNSFSIWQIDHHNREFNHIAQLQGHKCIVTAVTSIQYTSVIVTGDDLGYIRLWDLKYMRCLQVIKLSQQIRRLDFYEGQLIFADKRLNITEIDMPNKTNSQNYIFHFYNQKFTQLFIIRTHSCIVVSMQTGKIKQINILCTDQQQIYTALNLNNAFCVGTSKGNLRIFDLQFRKKRKIHIHDEQITQIMSDSDNTILITVSSGAINVWMQSSSAEEAPRKSLKNLVTDSTIAALELYQPYALIGISFAANYILLIDYQSMKMWKKIILPNHITCILFHPLYPILFISDESGAIVVLIFKKQEARFVICKKFILNLQNLGQGKTSNPGHEFYHKFLINQFDDELLFASNLGNLYKISCKTFIQEASSTKIIKKPFMEKSKHIHRPIQQSLFEDSSDNNNINNFQEVCIEYQQLCSCKVDIKNSVILKKSSIVQIYSLKRNQYLSVFCSKGQYFMLDYQSFSILSQRNADQTLPLKWEKMAENINEIKDKIISALKLLENIYNADFSLKVDSIISLPKLQVRKFITSLILQNQFDQQFLRQTKKKISIRKKQKSDIFHQDSIKMSLKQMQMQKRIQRMKQENLEKKNIINTRSLKRHQSPKKVKDQSLLDFLKCPQQHGYNNKENDSQKPCELYERIIQKFNNNKQARAFSNPLTSSSKIKGRNLLEQSEEIKRRPSINTRSLTTFHANSREKTKKTIDKTVIKQLLHKNNFKQALKKKFNYLKYQKLRANN